MESVISKTVKALSEVKECTDACWDAAGPPAVVTTEPIWKTVNELAKRGVRIRAITDICPDNISYCKMIAEIGIQLRHLPAIKTTFGINDRMEYINAVLSEEKKAPAQYIVSNVKTFVEGQQSVFDTLWSNALPAKQKIEEIEEGIEHVETKVIENQNEIINYVKHIVENASKRLLCSSSNGMQFIYDHYFDLYKKIIDKQKRGEGEGIRWITSINDARNIELVKIFLNAGAQIKHIRDLPPMNFALDDRYFHGTIDRYQDMGIVRSLLISNEPSYVKHFTSIFEEMWEKAADASEVIRNIEKGVDVTKLEPHALDDEEDMKAYLNEVLNEITQ